MRERRRREDDGYSDEGQSKYDNAASPGRSCDSEREAGSQSVVEARRTERGAAEIQLLASADGICSDGLLHDTNAGGPSLQKTLAIQECFESWSWRQQHKILSEKSRAFD
jgi:hypothetical protein